MIVVVIGFRQQSRQMEPCNDMSFRAKSRNLRIRITFAVESVPRSFDSLRSLRMTTASVLVLLYVLITTTTIYRSKDYFDTLRGAL